MASDVSPPAVIALLRGINVGARNRIAMADLREIVEDLGGAQARTHLQSGNVVFVSDGRAGTALAEVRDSDASGSGLAAGVGAAAGLWTDRIARAIEHAIERQLGLSVPVLVRTADELMDVVEGNPLGDVASNPSRLLVSFLSGEVRRDRVADLDPERFLPDRFAFGRREIYVWAPRGASETKLTHAFWEKRLALTATARNWNTVQRLLQMAGPAPGAARRG